MANIRTLMLVNRRRSAIHLTTWSGYRSTREYLRYAARRDDARVANIDSMHPDVAYPQSHRPPLGLVRD